jgi:hypothetical protein
MLNNIADFENKAKSRLNAKIRELQKTEAAWQQRCLEMLCHLLETANRPVLVENLLLADRYLNNTFGGLNVETLTRFARHAKASGLVDMQDSDQGWLVYRARHQVPAEPS